MELSIKSINGTRNINVNEKCNVEDLKNMIMDQCGAFSEEQNLYFENTLLDDNKKLLTSYGIRSKSEINCNIEFSDITVIVSYNNQTSEIKVNKNDRGIDLKYKIQKNINKPVVEQYLLYKDKHIEDNQKLSIYGLTEKSVIILVDKVTKENQTLVVRLNEKENFNINYVDKIRVEDVLKQVEEKFPNKNMEHSILLNNKVLNRQDTIEKCKGSPFQSLIVQSSINTKPSIIQLFVISPDNKTTAIHISKKVKCLELKKMIFDNLAISVELQGLSFNGVSLEDEKLLEFYGLADKSIINVLIRLRGG